MSTPTPRHGPTTPFPPQGPPPDTGHPARRHGGFALGLALAAAIVGGLAIQGSFLTAPFQGDDFTTTAATAAPKATPAPAPAPSAAAGDDACEAELRREFESGNASPDLPACAAVGKDRASEILDRISPELIASAAAGGDSSGDSAAEEPAGTVAQQQALESAQSYIAMTGFSKKGLMRQLTSEAGEGFSKSDAQWAVARVKVDWNDEAVESARSYLDMGGFSRAGLIRQLSSSAGEQFTKAQAVYAVDEVGL